MSPLATALLKETASDWLLDNMSGEDRVVVPEGPVHVSQLTPAVKRALLAGRWMNGHSDKWIQEVLLNGFKGLNAFDDREVEGTLRQLGEADATGHLSPKAISWLVWNDLLAWDGGTPPV